jgi:hypothetical protein
MTKLSAQIIGVLATSNLPTGLQGWDKTPIWHVGPVPVTAY